MIKYLESSYSLYHCCQVLKSPRKYGSRVCNCGELLFTVYATEVRPPYSLRDCIPGQNHSTQSLRTGVLYTPIQTLRMQSLRLTIPVNIRSKCEYLEASAVNQLASWLAFLYYIVLGYNGSVLSIWDVAETGFCTWWWL